MEAFTPESQWQSLLDVEAALAAAEADAGVIPAWCVADIRAAARADQFDLAALTSESTLAGNIVIPLVKQLREAVRARRADAAQYVHYGATSQDILDTALVLELRAASSLIDDALARAMAGTALHARAHATTAMAGRTWLQQASPTTFGLKAAGWLDSLGRGRQRLQAAMTGALVVQLGGASGTLASLGDAGSAVMEAFARHLELGVPDMPWQSQRDRIVHVAAALGIACGVTGKIGRDLVLLAQTEVGEVRERGMPGEGTSTAMPHKQNPVRAVTAIAGAIRAPQLVATMLAAMPQEHERAAGGWQAEWATMPELVRVTHESCDATAQALSQIEVDVARMRDNLQARGGLALSEALVSALSGQVSRPDAAAIVERLCRAAAAEQRTLHEVAIHDANVRQALSPPQIESALTPEHYLGSAAAFIDRVLRKWGG
jgi:3-carboxy-cis,cis-muconate cycloisomerase